MLCSNAGKNCQNERNERFFRIFDAPGVKHLDEQKAATPVKRYSDYELLAREMAALHNIPVRKNVGVFLSEGKGILKGMTVPERISFTPYVHNACSARCGFCSERLIRRHAGPGNPVTADFYSDKLGRILKDLSETELFLSVSGMEPLEDSAFVERALARFQRFEEEGGRIAEKVIYSNLSKAARDPEDVVRLVARYRIDRIETSRHHFDEGINERIMRFKRGQPVVHNDCYESAIRYLRDSVALRLACVVQKTGIHTLQDVIGYIDWAVSIGINDITFRELSVFGNEVTGGSSYEYILLNRQNIYLFIENLPNLFRLEEIIQGYYYFSFRYIFDGRVSVAFEASDYEEMIRHHSGSVVSKLIYYPNGDLCMDWNMGRKVY